MEKTKVLDREHAEYGRIDVDEIPLPSGEASKRHSPLSILVNGVHYCRRVVPCRRVGCDGAAVRRIVSNGVAKAAVRDTCPQCGHSLEMPLGDDGKI